jgi:tRNA A-37 threonylcarbamoyl transferase component Bud32
LAKGNGDGSSASSSSIARGASSLKRFGASASARLTEGLLASSGRVAAVGLTTAVLTLVFTIWFRIELGYQSEVGAPMARAAAELAGAIDASLAALGGWVAYGNPRQAAERARVWELRIEPSLADLEKLARSSDDPLAEQEIVELKAALRELKRLQWVIEDVAQTPGNEPAEVAYTQRLEPLRHSILTVVHGAIEQYREDKGRSPSIDFLMRLAHFRSAFTESDLAIGQLLSDYSEAREHEVRERLQRTQDLALRVAAEAPLEISSDLLRSLEVVASEFEAYALQVPEVIALRRPARSNVALRLYNEQARPQLERSRALASALASAQAHSTTEDARRLTRGSYVVIAMALLMGLLSAGSLFVSYRLRRQVENVMKKAKTLGQYVLTEPIGKGGMGEVYLGHHAMMRRPTAIKLLRAENAQSLRAQRRFQQEVQLTCQLSHPNTIEIFDYGRTPEGLFYYAMEYLDGFTLKALVSRTGCVEPARVIHILVQACGSLEEAHANGLLHRDIKPSNIMLTCRGGVPDTLKILDFGLVKNIAGERDAVDEESGSIAGTPMYLAPESILSSEAATPQADLYALGAVGYFLLSGTTVFPEGNVTEVLARHLNEEPEFPSVRLGRKLPEDLEYVVMACLSKDPAERPESARVLAEMLRACDCASWSVEDARLWWDEYGEAAKAGIADGQVGETAAPSAIEIVVGATRG